MKTFDEVVSGVFDGKPRGVGGADTNGEGGNVLDDTEDCVSKTGPVLIPLTSDLVNVLFKTNGIKSLDNTDEIVDVLEKDSVGVLFTSKTIDSIIPVSSVTKDDVGVISKDCDMLLVNDVCCKGD